MRYLLLILSLAINALAARPVTAKDDPANKQVVFTNTSKRSIMAFEAEWIQPDGLPVKHRHDSFTQPMLMTPGMSMPLPDYSGQPVVKWVQFADGSTWGDAEAGEYLLAMRNAGYNTLVLLNSMTDSDFQAELYKPMEICATSDASTCKLRSDAALRGILIEIIGEESMASARQAVADRLSNANRNKATGKF